jgi:hypothetical protein
MGQIDHDVMGVELRHHFAAEIGETFVFRYHRTVAQLIARIVGQLDDAHAEPGEGRHAAGIVAHHRGVLETIDQADLVLGTGAQNVGGLFHT